MQFQFSLMFKKITFKGKITLYLLNYKKTFFAFSISRRSFITQSIIQFGYFIKKVVESSSCNTLMFSKLRFLYRFTEDLFLFHVFTLFVPLFGTLRGWNIKVEQFILEIEYLPLNVPLNKILATKQLFLSFFEKRRTKKLVWTNKQNKQIIHCFPAISYT